MDTKAFQLFDCKKMDSKVLPNVAGNYIFLLRENCQLPQIEIEPVITSVEIDGKLYQAIYTGIASNNLRQRDYRQHFIGNDASHSTLRKSLGCLFGYDFIPRKEGDTKNKKFNVQDETALSEWMKNDLLLAYTENSNPKPLENELISELNPPLNLSKNYNNANAEYRVLLSKLRRRPITGNCEKTSTEVSVSSSKVIAKITTSNGISKTIHRNVNFDRETNKYRCKYGDKKAFDVLRVECVYKGDAKVFEIESKNLPDQKDSIHFRAHKKGNSFAVEWTNGIGSYIKEVKV